MDFALLSAEASVGEAQKWRKCGLTNKAWVLDSENLGLHPDPTTYSWASHCTAGMYMALMSLK